MKKVIITGATGGVGKGIADYLCTREYELILSARKEGPNKAPANSTFYPVDFSDFGSITRYEQWVQQNHSLLDGIVLITPKPLLQNTSFPESCEWEDLFQYGFIGPLEFLKKVIPFLNKEGKVVIISGISSVQYMDNHSVFGVLRSMWLAQAKAMSFELGPRGIRVNSVSPGGVMTEKGIERMKKKAQDKGLSFEEQYQESTQNVPLRKYAQPEEIGGVVEFLLSDHSNHMTGVNLVCDGGFTRGY